MSREQFINFSRKLIESKIAKCYAIIRNKKILSAMLVVEDKSTAYALFSGKDFKYDKKDSELYLHYSLMNYYKDNNYKFFDLLGAMSPSIARVKLELGGQLERWDRAVYFKNRSSRMLYNFYCLWKNKKRVL